MGLIQELTRYLEAKLNAETNELEVDFLKNENIELQKEVSELKEKLHIAQQRKNDAIDEISLCQKRIDSLLRQLREKNGGEN